MFDFLRKFSMRTSSKPRDLRRAAGEQGSLFRLSANLYFVLFEFPKIKSQNFPVPKFVCRDKRDIVVPRGIQRERVNINVPVSDLIGVK
jgi:hypothetical protein